MGIYDRAYYRDEGFRPLTPWDQRTAIAIIITINVALFVLNFLLTARSRGVEQLLLLDPSRMSNPLEWYRLLTYGFTHSSLDVTHILFNMMSLYFLGRAVEDRYGRTEFSLFYVTALLLGGLYWTLRAWGQGSNMLGASGAVTAVCMLFVFCYPLVEIRFLGLIPMPAWIMGVLIIALNMYGGRRGVAYDVHLVGAAFAAVYFYGGLSFRSVESWLGGLKLSWKKKRSGLKVLRTDEDPEPVSNKEEREADRILAKIHASGQDSLTAAERKFMEAYSQSVRKRRAKSQ